MKTIGLIGGMSWESSLHYYRIINEAVKQRLGGLHSARCILYSVEFAEVEEMQRQGRWQESAALLGDVARRLEGAGAELIVICTNTMHKVAGEVQACTHVPLLHIADATAQKIVERGLVRVGLLGTQFTMEEGFYKDRLIQNYGLQVLIPNPAERQLVHRVIYEELCLGTINPASKEYFKGIIQKLVQAGAQGIILGCTEIGMLIQEPDSPVPLFDTTQIHAEAAVDFALEGTGALDE